MQMTTWSLQELPEGWAVKAEGEEWLDSISAAVTVSWPGGSKQWPEMIFEDEDDLLGHMVDFANLLMSK